MKEKIVIQELLNKNGYLTITDSNKRNISVKLDQNKGADDWFVGDVVELDVKAWKDKLFGNIPKVFPNQTEINKKICALNNATLLVCHGKVETKQLEKTFQKLLKML